MSWNVEWGGKATDYVPELLITKGKPGPVATALKDALWEALQGIGQKNPGAWVRAVGHGWEESSEPGSGRFTLSVQVLGSEPSEIVRRIEDQQPVDLTRGAVTSGNS